MQASTPAARPFDLEPAPAWFRRAFLAIGSVGAIVVLAHLGLAVWAQNEIAAAESIVALHSMMLANDGALYYSNQAYPYTITPYMPVFYGFQAALYKLGIPSLLAGRLISFAATLGILALAWRLVFFYTGNRWNSWLAVALCACSSLIPGWGTIGRVDVLAVFFALAAFDRYTRRSLVWAGFFAVAAIMTKQTLVAAPAAICILLWFENRKLAVKFAAGVLGSGVALVAILDGLLQGRFLFNTAFANLNPFAVEKLYQHGEFFAIAMGQVVIVAAAGAWPAIRSRARAPFVYLGLSFLVLIATAAKIGSDTNYHVESAVLFIVCACVSLHQLDFFNSVFLGRKTWVTLLQLPLLIHMVNNVRIVIPFFQTRIVSEYEVNRFSRNLEKYLTAKDPILAADFNSLIRTRGRLDIEPLIYNLLVRAGRIDPEPVRREIAAGRVPVIMLYQDVNQPQSDDPEIPTLPEVQLAEVRKHYRLVTRVPGSYLGGVYVYEPAGNATQTAAANRGPQ
jgi:hypothetical protein